MYYKKRNKCHSLINFTILCYRTLNLKHFLTLQIRHSFVVKTLLSVREVWGLNLGPADWTQCRQRLARFDFFNLIKCRASTFEKNLLPYYQIKITKSVSSHLLNLWKVNFLPPNAFESPTSQFYAMLLILRNNSLLPKNLPKSQPTTQF